MKKSLFFIPAAALILASCSNEDFEANQQSAYDGPTETRYLSVNVVDNYTGTRAGEDDPVYENGSEAENAVSYVRFYLFGQTGSDYKNTSVNCTAEEVTNTQTPNVEKVLHSVIVFEAPEGSTEPIQIVAVVNPPTGLADAYDTPAELQAKVADYGVATAGNFIMSNSVFKDNDGNEHIAYQISKSYSSREEALLNPVDVYVERVVAKTRVKTSMNKVEGQDYYTLKPANDARVVAESGTAQVDVYNPTTETLEATDVYVKLLGWNVTATAQESRLVKKIQTTNWNSLAWDWNLPNSNRSFWAENPETVESADALKLDNFTAAGTFGFNPTPATGEPLNYTYLQENASWTFDGKNPGKATKLIVAAQLVGADGKGIDLAWWKGTYYKIDGLLQVLANETKVYSLADGKYTPLAASNLVFKTNEDVKGGADRNYFSYAQLNGDLAGTNWYVKNGDGTYTQISGNVTAAVNQILLGLEVAKVWTGGHAYYWVDIAHLGKNGYGDFGVVRNHIYDYDLTMFQGFGIPVLDDDDEIDPETPNDPEYAFIAARLNILSWRIVKHDDQSIGWESNRPTE